MKVRRQDEQSFLADADILIENFKTGALRNTDGLSSLSKQFPQSLILLFDYRFWSGGPLCASRAMISSSKHVRPDVDYRFDRTASPETRDGDHGYLYRYLCHHGPFYLQRCTSGPDRCGPAIDMALLDCAVAVTAIRRMNLSDNGNAPTRMANAHPNLTPYEVFESSDGHLIIANGLMTGSFQRLVPDVGRLDGMANLGWTMPRMPTASANRPEIDRVYREPPASAPVPISARHALRGQRGVRQGRSNDMADMFGRPPSPSRVA